MKRWTWVVLVLASGCDVQGDPDQLSPVEPADPAADDTETPQSCDPDFGRVYVFDDIQLLPPGEGLDLDGDGSPDNALGALYQFANPAVREALDAGYVNMLIDFAPWMEDAHESPANLAISIFHGIDADGDPSNNFDGAGEFAVAKEQFDVSCNPTSTFEDVDYTEGDFYAATNEWALFLRFVGGVEFTNVHMKGTVADDMASVSGQAGAVWTLCSMSTAPFPGSYPGSWLDLLANDSILLPDIDLDGDGIEQVVGNGDTVVACIDGDGTEIPGAFCPCDPRIADAYSAGMYAHGVAAVVTEVVETSP